MVVVDVLLNLHVENVADDFRIADALLLTIIVGIVIVFLFLNCLSFAKGLLIWCRLLLHMLNSTLLCRCCTTNLFLC